LIVNESTALIGSFFGGTGNGFIAFEVDTYGDLPNPADYPGRLAVVINSSGLFWNRRKGLYRSDGASWSRLSNNTLLVLDNELSILNNVDNSKILKFSNNQQSTGTTRIVSNPDYDFDLGKPLVSYVDGITGLGDPAYNEGRLFYDHQKKTWSLYNDRSSVKLQIGRELWVRACNKTTLDIINGRVVAISGVETGCPTIELAQADEFDKSRIIGVATEDILIDQQGEVTSFGLVNNINTGSVTTGVVYLGLDGALTSVVPEGSRFTIIIGVVLVSDTTNGVLFVNPSISDITVEVTDTNGFPKRDTSILTFANTSPDRTFTISPVGDNFYYYINGKIYHKSSPESLQITNVEGNHAIYYDNTTLSEIVNPSDEDMDILIRTKALISIIYWNVVDSRHNYFADERHGISMSPETHSYLHFTRGAQFLTGLGLGDLITDGNGDLDAHAQFSIEGGYTVDEDLITSYNSISSTIGLPIYYLIGSNGDMRRITNSGFSVLDDITAGVDVTGRLVWNEFTGSTWQLTTVTNNYYILCHVLAINGYDGEDKQIAVIGQNEYSLVGDARIGAALEISNIVTRFVIPEIVPIATIIFQTGNTYANAVKARVRPAILGEDYVDWRTTELAQGSAASDHGNLTGLADDDHMQYVLLNGRGGGQYLYGGTASGDDITIESTSNLTKGNVFIQPNGGTTEIGKDLLVENIQINQDDIINNPIALEINNDGTGDSLNVNDLIKITDESYLRLDFNQRIVFGFTAVDPYVWYSYNETTGSSLPDISGNGRNGTTVNTPSWVSGKINNALSFNGTNQYVNCGNIAGFEVTDPFSIDTWFYKSSGGGGVLVSKRSGGDIGWSLHSRSSDQIHLYLGDGTVYLMALTNNSFALSTWHHVVATYDGSNTYAGMKLYVNNILQTTTNQSTGLPSTILNTTNMNVVGYNNGTALFNVIMDETLILPEEVDAAYVSNRWNGGAGTETYPGTSSVGYFINEGGKIFLNFGGNTKQFVYTGEGKFGIGTDTPDGLLDVTPDTITINSYSYPFPRVTTTQRNALTTMQTGAHVYDTDLDKIFYYDGVSWIEITSSLSTGDYHVNSEITVSNPDGSILRPYNSLQTCLNAIGAPVSTTDARRKITVHIKAGQYDENITVPKQRMMTFLCYGPVVIGDGAADDLYNSTTARSVTVQNTATGEPSNAPSRSMFAIKGVSGETSSTHSAYGAGNMIISGDLQFNHLDGNTTTHETCLVGVKVQGNVTANSFELGSIHNFQCSKCFFDNTFNLSNVNINVCESTEFDGLITASGVGRFVNCEIDGGLTASMVDLYPPNGFFDCDVGSGTWTITNAVVNETTRQQIVDNTITVTGGYVVTANTAFTDGINSFTVQQNFTGPVGVGTSSPNTSSIVDIVSTTKGFLPPRMTTTERNNISSPSAGLVVYNTTTNKHQGYNGTSWNDFY
jgi:hypothetical protein